MRLISTCVQALLLLLLFSLSARAAQPLATFTLTERLNVDWPLTLVNYPVEFPAGKCKPEAVRLVDEQGNQRLVQLWRVRRHPDGSVASARVAFQTDLPPGATRTYQLLAEPPQPQDTPVSAQVQDGYLWLDNGRVGVRLPPPGEVKLEAPAAFPNAYDPASPVAGPFRGLRLADGRWTGGSFFWATDAAQAPKITGYECKITELGPLFAEAQVRYGFDNGGFYQFTARVIAGEPAVRIDEQSDLQVIRPGWDWRMVFSLVGPRERDTWRPDAVFLWSYEGRIRAKLPELDAKFAALGFDTKATESADFGAKPIAYTEPYAKVCDVVVWYPWSASAHYFGLVDSATLSPEANLEQVPFLGVVPLHAGTWRQASGDINGMLFSYQTGELQLHWPLYAWPHPNTLLHTGEYDPDLPLSFMRRQWALVGGGVQYQDGLKHFRSYEGCLTLDQYKDWILSWPVDPKVTYPRLVFSKEEADRMKPRLATLAGGDILSKFLYFGDDEQRFQQLWNGLTYRSIWSSPYGQVVDQLAFNGGWISSYRQSQMAGWAGNMDELLSSPRLTPEQRERLRSDLAALCYLLTDPDFNPRGCMVHLGNPNMPINRQMGLFFAAALIPDHPRAQEWLDLGREYLRYKLAMNVGPGGAWSELITYFQASAPHCLQAATVLGQTGRLDESTAQLAALPALFTMHLVSPPDPRFAARMLPNWGHEGYDMPTHWMLAAGLRRKRDPELAKALAWTWNELGRPMQQHHDAGFSERVIFNADLLADLPPNYVPPQLKSVWLPGFGAVLRAHPGDPLETYMSYRQGYLTSHCDANQGDFLLYAKGAPLVNLSLFGYAIHDNRPFYQLYNEFGWHSRVRFGSMTNNGGWPGGGPISQIHAHGFSDSVDYIRGLGDYGPQRWTRQVMLLKGKSAAGPNYYVFRDSFHNLEGNDAALEQKWWYLRTLGAADNVRLSASGLDYTSPFGPRLNLHFLMPATVTGENRDATQGGPLYNQAALNWQKAGSPVKSGQGTNISVEETITVNAFGPIAPGQDILVALYPQMPQEAPPTYRLLAPGVAEVRTSEATDFVFLGREPVHFTQGQMSFRGRAGAVRVYRQEVHLVISEGPGEITYQGVTLRSPIPAARIIPARDLQRKQVIEIPAPRSSIQFSLDAAKGAILPVEAGVRKQVLAEGFAYAFDSPTPLQFEREGVVFRGRRGEIEVNEKTGTVRVVMLDGERVGYRSLQAWDCAGPYEVTFERDRILGRTSGLGRILYVSRPAGLDRLPMLVLDKQTFAPGTSGDTLILPVMPGEHEFEVRALPQPPIYRTWQEW